MQKNSLIETRGLLAAIVIHIIVGQFFVFSVPLQGIPERPEFVFWGAFLSGIERPPSAPQTFPVDYAGISLMPHAKSSSSEKELVKPVVVYAEDFGNDSKKFQKTTFLREELPASIYQYPHSRHYQNTKVEYQPLRFHPYYVP